VAAGDDEEKVLEWDPSQRDEEDGKDSHSQGDEEQALDPHLQGVEEEVLAPHWLGDETVRRLDPSTWGEEAGDERNHRRDPSGRRVDGATEQGRCRRREEGKTSETLI
jgi:hypothetical protein